MTAHLFCGAAKSILFRIESDEPFTIEGRKLQCNSNIVKIKYIARVEDPNEYDALLSQALAAYLAHLLAMPIVQSNSLKEQMWEQEQVDDAEVLVVAFGIHGRMCKDLVESCRAKGKRVGYIRPITLWPFPDKAFENLPASVKSILVVEMNHGQMIDDVRLAVNGQVPVHFLGKTGGDIPMCTLADMNREVGKLLEGE